MESFLCWFVFTVMMNYFKKIIARCLKIMDLNFIFPNLFVKEIVFWSAERFQVFFCFNWKILLQTWFPIALRYWKNLKNPHFCPIIQRHWLFHILLPKKFNARQGQVVIHIKNPLKIAAACPLIFVLMFIYVFLGQELNLSYINNARYELYCSGFDINLIV